MRFVFNICDLKWHDERESPTSKNKNPQKFLALLGYFVVISPLMWNISNELTEPHKTCKTTNKCHIEKDVTSSLEKTQGFMHSLF